MSTHITPFMYYIKIGDAKCSWYLCNGNIQDAWKCCGCSAIFDEKCAESSVAKKREGPLKRFGLHLVINV